MNFAKGVSMEVGQIVEFETDLGSAGEGRITAIDHETETITVVDLQDGSVWTGSMDKAEVACP